MKRFLSLLLVCAMVLSLVPAVHAYGTPAATCNKDAQWYANAQRFATPVTSHLAYEDGGYLRVECVGDALAVERYSADFEFISGQSIDLELPLYGGVYIDDDYNFVVVGQTNYEENDETEVFRIIRNMNALALLVVAKLILFVVVIVNVLQVCTCCEFFHIIQTVCHSLAVSGLGHILNENQFAAVLV